MQPNPTLPVDEFPVIDELKHVYPQWHKVQDFLETSKEFIYKKLEKDKANIKGKYEPWRTQIEQTRSRKF